MKEGKNIWQRKDGRWEARYIRTYDGRRAVYGSVYAATYEDARKKQQAAQPGGTRLDKTDIFSMSGAFLKQKQYAVKESTLALYENTIRNRIFPYWQDVRLCDISKQKINGFYTDLFAKGLSPKSVKDTLTLLRGILSYAHGIGMLPDVPTFPSIHSIRFCADVLSEKEQKTLTAYLTQNPDFGKIGVLLSLMTGMRIGEICALQKGDMDFSDGHICVRRTLQRLHAPSADGRKTKLMTDSPKSASSERKIPLPARLCAWLYPLYAGLTDDSYILTGTPTPTEPRSYYRVYQRHLAACGLPHHTFHALRHTFATEAVRSGMDVKSLSEILGHAGVKITLERYVHPSEEQKKTAMETFFCSQSLPSCLPSESSETLAPPPHSPKYRKG